MQSHQTDFTAWPSGAIGIVMPRRERAPVERASYSAQAFARAVQSISLGSPMSPPATPLPPRDRIIWDDAPLSRDEAVQLRLTRMEQ